MGWTKEQPKSERVRMSYEVVRMHSRKNQVTNNQEGYVNDLKKSRSFFNAAFAPCTITVKLAS